MSREFDEKVIEAVRRTGPHALPSAVYEDMVLNDQQDDPGFARVYTKLERLADKGLLRQTRIIDDRGREHRAYSMPNGTLHPVRRRISAISRALATT